jgi:hypothetical protein
MPNVMSAGSGRLALRVSGFSGIRDEAEMKDGDKGTKSVFVRRIMLDAAFASSLANVIRLLRFEPDGLGGAGAIEAAEPDMP